MKIDIVTGFLGAGKTTFISRYVQYIKKQNEKVLIIENEFGLAGIDKALLMNEGLEVAEISGGCVCCTQAPKLIACLVQAYEQGCDRVIFEPSGIYNVDTFFTLMQQPSLAGKCELNAIITIVKPEDLSHRDGIYQNILTSQFLSAGALVFSHVHAYTAEEITQAVLSVCDFCRTHSEAFDIDKLLLYTKEWSDFSDSDYEKLASVGRSYFTHQAIVEHHVSMVEQLFFAAKIKRHQDIEPLLRALFQMKDREVIRVKGYIQAADKGLFLVNCTSTCFSIQEHNGKHAVLNVIGANIEERDIKALVQAYE